MQETPEKVLADLGNFPISTLSGMLQSSIRHAQTQPVLDSTRTTVNYISINISYFGTSALQNNGGLREDKLCFGHVAIHALLMR